MGKDTEKKEFEKKESEKKESEKKYEELESKVKAMEKKVKELENILGEKEETESEERFVENLVSSLIPGFGKIVKTLEKTSPEFRQRIAETDSEIKHRLETGWTDKKPSINYGFSIRPLSTKPADASVRKKSRKKAEKITEVKLESPEIEPVFDVFEEENQISVIAEIPGASEEDLQVELEANKLKISAGMYSKVITLPLEAGEIQEKSFKNSVLQLKIRRRENAD